MFSGLRREGNTRKRGVRGGQGVPVGGGEGAMA